MSKVAELRQVLELAHEFAKSGVMFIPVPVDGDQEALAKLMMERIVKLAEADFNELKEALTK